MNLVCVCVLTVWGIVQGAKGVERVLESWRRVSDYLNSLNSVLKLQIQAILQNGLYNVHIVKLIFRISSVFPDSELPRNEEA